MVPSWTSIIKMGLCLRVTKQFAKRRFLYCVGTLSLFITIASFRIYLLVIIPGETWCTKNDSCLVSSWKRLYTLVHSTELLSNEGGIVYRRNMHLEPHTFVSLLNFLKNLALYTSHQMLLWLGGTPWQYYWHGNIDYGI